MDAKVAKLFYFLLMLVALCACASNSDSLKELVVDQNEKNINQLKEIAKEAGWGVSPKVGVGDRGTPLTKEELDAFKMNLQLYADYPRIQKEREIELVSVENLYLCMFPFSIDLKTKAYGSGSVMVYATYGYCWSNKCNKIPIKVNYDLDEHGGICYAFAGSDFFVKDCGCPYVLTQYTTAYYECEWNVDWVYIKVWLNCSKYDSSFSDAEHLMVTGTVYINTGTSNLDVQYMGKGNWKPTQIPGIEWKIASE